MKTSSLLSVAVVATLAAPFVGFCANWPGWRGDGSGISTAKNLPVKWSPTENVKWRVELPERGNSSPIVWGDRIFVTQAVTAGNRRTVICYDRGDGKVRWQAGVTYLEREQTQRDNPYCSATPVTDGERVIASFGSAGVYCYDFDGKELWHRDLGKMNHMFGNAASPVLAGNLCIIHFGPDENARLIAVDKRTGATAWEARPPKIEVAEPAERGLGGGGPVGRGGRAAFGPGQIIASQLLAQGDTDRDGKLSATEFTAVAEKWFKQLDTDNAAKLNAETFGERLANVLPPPRGFGPPEAPDAQNPDRAAPPANRPDDGARRGFGPERFIAPGLFGATDANKDGTLAQPEWTATFAKWFGEWDSSKTGALDEDKLRDGFNAALPRPQFGGPGGRGFGGPGGRGAGGPAGSWSTPLVLNADARAELVYSFAGGVAAYDPSTGKELWLSKGLGGTIYTSPLWGDGTLIATSSGMGGGNAIALRPGGAGDVTESKRIWRQERVKSAIGTGVIYQGHLYTVSQDGIAECLDLKTGGSVWQERLKGNGSRGSSWSSILLADDRLYIPNQSGDVFVVRAAPHFELLATNSMSEPTNASLAVGGDGELLMRTDKALWCIGSK